MTTVDPDTSARDPGVLRDIVRRFDGRLCLDASIVRAGSINEGDEVEFIRDDTAIGAGVRDRREKAS